jgi:hypothetical protein
VLELREVDDEFPMLVDKGQEGRRESEIPVDLLCHRLIQFVSRLCLVWTGVPGRDERKCVGCRRLREEERGRGRERERLQQECLDTDPRIQIEATMRRDLIRVLFGGSGKSLTIVSSGPERW